MDIRQMLHRCKLISSLLLAAVCMAACSGSSTSSDHEDRIVEDVNLTELFKPPTPDERQEVLDDWDSRDHAANNVSPIAQSPVLLGTTAATLQILSHTVGTNIHYGAVLSPDDAAPGSLPVVVYLHGGDNGVDVSELLLVLPTALGNDRDDYVYMVASFRSEELRHGGVTYTSTGEPSPWDRDVDDLLSFIDAALTVAPAADSERIGLVGFSRGACVAMLAGIRDSRIDLVIEFFGPTDFFSQWSEDIFAEALEGSLRDLPGLSTLNADVIQPLKNGSLAPAQARLEMLKRSPTYFVEMLPPTQGHHGTFDNVVPVSEAYLLREALAAEGLTAPDYSVYIYNVGGHNPATLSGSFERSRDFLTRLKNPAQSIVTDGRAYE